MSKTLVAYFSASGVTERVANVLADEAKADLYSIHPATPYTGADLNWQDSNSRSSKEMRNKNSRPALADKDANIQKYDIVFLGFPIWWYIAPTIINTFLETYDFSGKTIILFATSGGSGFGKTVQALKYSVNSSAVIQEGRVFSGRFNEAAIRGWISEIVIAAE